MCNARKDGRDLQVQGLLNKGSHAFINKHVRNGEHIEEVDNRCGTTINGQGQIPRGSERARGGRVYVFLGSEGECFRQKSLKG